MLAAGPAPLRRAGNPARDSRRRPSPNPCQPAALQAAGFCFLAALMAARERPRQLSRGIRTVSAGSMQSDVGPPPFRQAQGPELVEGLVGRAGYPASRSPTASAGPTHHLVVFDIIDQPHGTALTSPAQPSLYTAQMNRLAQDQLARNSSSLVTATPGGMRFTRSSSGGSSSSIVLARVLPFDRRPSLRRHGFFHRNAPPLPSPSAPSESPPLVPRHVVKRPRSRASSSLIRSFFFRRRRREPPPPAPPVP